jgi:hypothetical protein
MTKLISGGVGLVMIVTGAGLAYVWGACRVYVEPDEQLVMIKKTGAPLPPGSKIAEPGQKGIQRDSLGPGRYFLNPWTTETERHPLVLIPAGTPETWKEVIASGDAEYAVPKIEGEWPQVGVVISLAGKAWTGEDDVVPEGFQGVQRAVLTPGTYRLNPRAFTVKLEPAVVVPLGCVGIVTSQVGDMPGVEVVREASIGPDGETIEGQPKTIQKLAGPGQRGVLENVLQPGIYYLNPYVYKVRNVQIGYNQITQLKTSDLQENIAFPSADGFTIEVEVTVVWGRHPEHTAEMINHLGDVKRLRQIILSNIRSICRNLGSEYESTDFIRGEKRELYQLAVTETLQKVAAEKDIEILIALIHNIEVRSSSTVEEGIEDLKETIQRGYIAKERDLTTQAKQETAKVKADLETSLAQIEVAREQITADTRKKVAEILAEAAKSAEEIDAQRDLEVARIERQIAELDAEQRLVLGRAEAEVSEMKNRAAAEGKALMIGAFGNGRAYNLFTFAENFKPESIRLIFAGEGTFWTDLSRAQDAAMMDLLKQSTSQ